MNRQLRHVTAVALAGSVLALAAGCGGGGGSSSGGSPASGSTNAGAAQRGGTLTMLWNAVGSSIDTGVDYDSNWPLLRMTNDGLMTWKQVGGPQGNQLVPDLAQSTPKPTDGGRTYTFTLRKGIRYSTGKPVKASDVRATIEREFKIPGPGTTFYMSIVGAKACNAKPKSCDLSKGIVTDDNAGTVTFHLTAPDGDFLSELAMPFAYVLPAGTPAKDTGTNPLPATGPYEIDHYTPNQEMVFVRNPRFHEWSHDAQPAGNPDRLVMKIGLSLEDETTQVANNQADWMYDIPPADRLNDIATKYPSQIHVNPTFQVWYMAMNVNVAPFNNKQVRQAINFATDRKAVVSLFGGPRLAQATCQVLPPNFPGYQPDCPYTKSPGQKWTAPDMAKAKQLVAQSGTKGTKVTIVTPPDETNKNISLYFVSLLKQLGYPASIKTLSNSVEYPYVQDSRNKVQMDPSWWQPDYVGASNFLNVPFGCAGYHKASTASPNLSGYCNPAIQRKTKQAMSMQTTNPAGANRLWAQIDRMTTDDAPAVELFVANRFDFLSSRVHNYAFNPSTVGWFMMDQASVK